MLLFHQNFSVQTSRTTPTTNTYLNFATAANLRTIWTEPAQAPATGSSDYAGNTEEPVNVQHKTTF
jgi:hypothetical protein